MDQTILLYALHYVIGTKTHMVINIIRDKWTSPLCGSACGIDSKLYDGDSN